MKGSELIMPVLNAYPLKKIHDAARITASKWHRGFGILVYEDLYQECITLYIDLHKQGRWPSQYSIKYALVRFEFFVRGMLKAEEIRAGKRPVKKFKLMESSGCVQQTRTYSPSLGTEIKEVYHA
jgi:hypothetical protein